VYRNTPADSDRATDIATSYAFDKQEYRVDAPDFAPDFHHASEKVAKQSHLMKQFPWLLRLSQKMPDHWITAIDPDLGAYINLQRVSYHCFLPELKHYSFNPYS